MSLRTDIDDLRRAMHADHECVPGRCKCVCGCEVEMGCSVAFGPLCSVCSIRVLRDEGDGPHGYPVQTGAGHE